MFGGGLQQEPIQRLPLVEKRLVRGSGKAVLVLALVKCEVQAQHRNRSPNRVEVGCDRWPHLGHLGRLEALRPKDRSRMIVNLHHSTNIDQLDAISDRHHVGRLQVVVDQVLVVQIPERWKNPQHVRQGFGHRERVVLATVGLAAVLSLRAERLPAHKLHDDVARAFPGHEVVDVDDAAVLDPGEELSLGHCRRHRIYVVFVEEPFQYHPAIRHCGVLAQIDPTHTAVGDRAEDAVLLADELARGEFRFVRDKVELGSTVSAEPLQTAWFAILPAPDGLATR